MGSVKHYSVSLNGVDIFSGSIRSSEIVFKAVTSSLRILGITDYTLLISFKLV